MDSGKQQLLLRRTMATLKDDLERENLQWKPQLYLDNVQVGEVGSEDRLVSVLWMEEQCRLLGFHADSLCLAVTLMDAFLARVRVKVKYLTCVTVTCLYLAAKLCEEDELIPTISYVVELTRPGCTSADVLRMERIVLDKLEWQVRLVTPLSFLQPLHQLLLASCPQLAAVTTRVLSHWQLCRLTSRLVTVMLDARALHVAPSRLTAALLSAELTRCQMTLPSDKVHWLIQATASEFTAACRLVDSILPCDLPCVLVAPPIPTMSVVAASKRQRHRGDSRSFSRPAKRQLVTEAHEDPSDEFVTDIRHLYTSDHGATIDDAATDERSNDSATLMRVCGLLSRVTRRSYADVLRLHLPVSAM